MKAVFKRRRENPILTPLDLPFPAAAVLNPGVTEQDGQVVLLLRVEDHAGYSNIHVARSKNGVSGWKVESEPILRYGLDRWRYEQWGCEDARVVYMDDAQRWYITYTAYSPAGPAVALAHSSDLATADRVGLIFSPNNKDAALFPQRFDGRWAVLHRPNAGGIENIWSAYSPDFIHWGEPHCVLTGGGGAAWDAFKVGAGPPPILTDRGWLLIYHGVIDTCNGFVYSMGAAIVDLNEPWRVLFRTNQHILTPEADYEVTGHVPNVVFPCAALCDPQLDRLAIYYGAADTSSCVAYAHLSELVEFTKENSEVF